VIDKSDALLQNDKKFKITEIGKIKKTIKDLEEAKEKTIAEN
jgi:hypothetical protein